MEFIQTIGKLVVRMCQNAHFLNQFQSGATIVYRFDGIDNFLVIVDLQNFVNPP